MKIDKKHKKILIEFILAIISSLVVITIGFLWGGLIYYVSRMIS